MVSMKKKARSIANKAMAIASVGAAVPATMAMTATTAFADFGTDDVTIASGGDAATMMGKIIGILLTITRFVGVALVVYGVYEVVMSFMQQQPEAKTRGIVMALAGIVMTALKSILSAIGVIG